MTVPNRSPCQPQLVTYQRPVSGSWRYSGAWASSAAATSAGSPVYSPKSNGFAARNRSVSWYSRGPRRLVVKVVDSQYAPPCANTNGDSVAAQDGCLPADGAVRRAKRTKRQSSRFSDTQTLTAASAPRLAVAYMSQVSSSSRSTIWSRITP